MQLVKTHCLTRSMQWELRIMIIRFVTVTYLLQIFVLSYYGGKLTYNLRSRVFKNILRQEIGWFDDKKNSTGALVAQLSNDAGQVEGVRKMLEISNAYTWNFECKWCSSTCTCTHMHGSYVYSCKPFYRLRAELLNFKRLLSEEVAILYRYFI